MRGRPLCENSRQYRQEAREAIKEKLDWAKTQRKILWGNSVAIDAARYSDIPSTLGGRHEFGVNLRGKI